MSLPATATQGGSRVLKQAAITIRRRLPEGRLARVTLLLVVVAALLLGANVSGLLVLPGGPLRPGCGLPECITPGVALRAGLPVGTPLYLTAPKPDWGVDVQINHIGVVGASEGVVIRRVLVPNADAGDPNAPPSGLPDAGDWLGRVAGTRSGPLVEPPVHLVLPDCCEPADALVVEFELADGGPHSLSGLDIDYRAGLLRYRTFYPLTLDEASLRSVGYPELTPTDCVTFPFSCNQDLARQRQQAQAALARWAAAVETAGGQQGFVPVGDLYAQVGDWDTSVADNDKGALAAGAVIASVDLPTDTPADAGVRWDDGTTRTMHLISAKAALEALRLSGNQDCKGCVPLQVTAAKLTTAKVLTSRGPAIAPAWEFTLEGTQVRVTRVAVAPRDMVIVTRPAWDPINPPAGTAIESAAGNVSGTQLAVTFNGNDGQGDVACGSDYTAEAVESDLAAAIIVTEQHSWTLLPGAACAGVGVERTATTQLKAPLGNRTVLEVTQGQPVPVTLTP